MNEKTTEIINTILEKSLTVAQKTGNFVIDQSPDLIKQLLNWELTIALIAFIIGILTILAGIFISKTVIHTYNKNDSDYKNMKLYTHLIIDIFAFFVALMIWDINNILNAIKIIIAPKLFLLEYTANLIK